MISLDIAEILPQFPTYRVALVVATDLTIGQERPPALMDYIASVEADCRARYAGLELGDIPEVRRWRQAYKAFGVKKTSFRSSVERLLRRVIQGEGLPQINTLVDAYNAISVAFRVPAGADDLDFLAPPLAYRYTREGDTFFTLGEDAPDPPEPSEVVYTDTAHILCRRWNWRQDARSAIRDATLRVTLNIESLDDGTASVVEEAARTLGNLLEVCCGARCDWAVADMTHPVVSVAEPT
ncbi:MAG TPA: phenylalanine--tRNA ligase beta subunit-related protein [Ktedonobacterales bacterium]|jgi:DNA/RNA-binding domain of Phe-tRNA-synthetase-like protein